MLSNGELHSLAQEVADKGIARMLEGSFDVIPVQDSMEWDSILHRQVFTQLFNVWRTFDELHFEASPNGEIISFRDENRFTDAKYECMNNLDILRICRTTGVIGPKAFVEAAAKDSGEMLVADIVEPFPGKSRRIRFTINPTSCLVAEFQTME
ncbi:MAG: hypothetical protein PHF56_15700 [Desulfuromonadaceae bacterium]|nr:hypothetical protein [Desulfuromonadaceae bacterium]